MGFVKKALKKVTGADKAEDEAKKAAKRAAREQEEAMKRQAEIDAANQAATALGGDNKKDQEVSGEQTQSTEKKKVRQGRKALTVARAGGQGINV